MGENIIVAVTGSHVAKLGDDCPDLNDEDMDDSFDMRASIADRSMIGITSPHKMRIGDSSGKHSRKNSRVHNTPSPFVAHQAVKSIKLRNQDNSYLKTPKNEKDEEPIFTFMGADIEPEGKRMFSPEKGHRNNVHFAHTTENLSTQTEPTLVKNEHLARQSKVFFDDNN